MRQAKPPKSEEPYVTRNDQLALKPDQERGRGRGRGRGKGDRGKGRGRAAEKNKAQPPKKEENWDNWYDQTWYDEWGRPDEEWGTEGWGQSAYYWDKHAWQDGKVSLQKLQDDKSDPKKRKSAKSADKKEEVAEDAKEPDETAEIPKKKAKKKQNETAAEPSAASAPTAKKRKTTEEPKTEKAARSSKKDTSEKVEKSVKAKGEKTKGAKDAASEPAPASKRKEPKQQQSQEKDVKDLWKFLRKYMHDESTEACQEIKDAFREDLKTTFSFGRLNIYWKTPACGVTSKHHNTDIARFNFHDFEDCNYMSLLALSLKAAEKFVTWLHAATPKSSSNVCIAFLHFTVSAWSILQQPLSLGPHCRDWFGQWRSGVGWYLQRFSILHGRGARLETGSEGCCGQGLGVDAQLSREHI